MSLIQDVAAVALRQLDPEKAHELAIKALAAGLGHRDRTPEDPILRVDLAGLPLANGVGLAAGFDKNAQAPDAMLAAGFGFVECGTVTPRPQAGNPRPRLFRLAADRALINRMGFKNEGLDAFARRLRARCRNGVVGANLGANKDSTDRIGDYVLGLKALWGLADYFTVNVSSPNTPGLRDLQSEAALAELAGRLAEARAGLRAAGGPDYPVFLKVAPDLAEADVPGVVRTVRAWSLDGVIVSNTTVARPASLVSPQRNEAGGLSGAPLMGPSTHMLRLFHQADRDLVLIGAGGIGSGADAYAKIRAGAHAVQLYSALVYAGPGLVARIKRDLAIMLRGEGFTSLAAARGTGI
jgi:dihydroorotate dehydrogenase